MLFRDHDQFDRAVADFDAALKLDPRDAPVWNARGGAFLLKGDSECAHEFRCGDPVQSEDDQCL